MIFNTKYDSISETNLFLRALWALIRDGQRMGWHTSGAKDAINQTIFIGHVSSATLETEKAISVTYHKRGCISKLIVSEPNDKEIYGNDKNFIIDVVEKAKKFHVPSIAKRFSVAYSSPHQFRLSPYKSEKLYLRTVLEHALCIANFEVLAFDTEDAKYLVQKTVPKIADFLSVSCSIPIHTGAKAYEETEHIRMTEGCVEIYVTEASDIGAKEKISIGALTDITVEENINKYCDESWIDEYPQHADCLQLPRSAFLGLNEMLYGAFNSRLLQYQNATRLYNTACKYEALSFGKKGYYGFDIIGLDLAPVEIANTLYMSSFETLASVLDNSVDTCKACNQPKYKIRQKVLDLFRYYFGANVHLNMIDQYYVDRSNYVHAGLHLGDRSYAGVSMPQLDASNKGMVSQMSITNLHIMREVGGELFRRVLKDII